MPCDFRRALTSQILLSLLQTREWTLITIDSIIVIILKRWATFSSYHISYGCIPGATQDREAQ